MIGLIARPVTELMLAAQIWPQDQFPMRRVGKLTLNQNTANFFNENEQLAFSPAHILPGKARCVCRCPVGAWSEMTNPGNEYRALQP